MYFRLHYVAADGKGAAELAKAIYNLGPEPREIEPRKIEPQSAPIGLTEMVSGTVVNQLQQVAGVVSNLPAAAGALINMASRPAAALSALQVAPRTRFNAAISRRRGKRYIAVSNLVGPRAALAGSNPFFGLVEPSRPTGSRPKYFYPGVSPRDVNSLVAGKEAAAAP
jgi:hypothetical protein